MLAEIEMMEGEDLDLDLDEDLRVEGERVCLWLLL